MVDTPQEFDVKRVMTYWLTEASEALVTITAFNIEARYPDTKRVFPAQCTPAFTARQMATIQDVFQWLTSLLP